MSEGHRERDSVLECSSPLELFAGHEALESAGGPAHSKTQSASVAKVCKHGLAFSGIKLEHRAVNIRRIALVCLAALSVWAAVSHYSGRRHSPKALELELVTSFLGQVLRRAEESPGQMQREIAERFSNEQIYQLAMTCRDWANGDTADPIGTLEDADTLMFCFFESLKVLKARGAKVQLRQLFLDARVNDGWRMLWYETLGADWLAKNPFVMPETDPQPLPDQ